MEIWITALSGLTSFLAILAIGLVSILYKNLFNEERELIAKVDSIRDNTTAMREQVQTIQRDLGRQRQELEQLGRLKSAILQLEVRTSNLENNK